MAADLVTMLKDSVGEENVSTDEIDRLVYSHDSAPIPREIGFAFRSKPDVIVRPLSFEDVADVLRVAQKLRVPVTLRAGASWAFGGAMPTLGGVVMDLTRLNEIISFDDEKGLITLQCGAVWKKVMGFLEGTDWRLPIYPSSAPSATVGGFAATGGLGYGSLQNGYFNENVIAAKAALPYGEIVEFKKDHEGPHGILASGEPYLGNLSLDKLFSSEGILGAFLELTIKLVPRGEVEKPFLAAFDDFQKAIEASKEVASKTKPFTIILHDGDYLKIKREAGFHAPDVGGILLTFYRGSEKDVEDYSKKLQSSASKHGGSILPEEEAVIDWEERFHPMRVKRMGPTLLAADLLIPTKFLWEAVQYSRRIGAEAKIRTGMDAIVSLPRETIFLPMFLTDERRPMRFISQLAIVKKLNEFALGMEGRPYGYGAWNSFYIGKTDPGSLAEFIALKRALDPNNILNPGKTFTLKTRFKVSVPGVLYGAMLRTMWFLRGMF